VSLPPDIDGDGFIDRYEYVDCVEEDSALDFSQIDYSAVTPDVRGHPAIFSRSAAAVHFPLEHTTTARRETSKLFLRLSSVACLRRERARKMPGFALETAQNSVENAPEISRPARAARPPVLLRAVRLRRSGLLRAEPPCQVPLFLRGRGRRILTYAGQL